MKHLLLTTIAAVVLVGCGESQQSAPAPEPPTAKAPDRTGSSPILEAILNISIHFAAHDGDIEAIKQHIADGADVNAKNDSGYTPLHWTAQNGHKEAVELLIAEGADVNAKDNDGNTPLDATSVFNKTEMADLLRKHGGKTKKELEASGN